MKLLNSIHSRPTYAEIWNMIPSRTNPQRRALFKFDSFTTNLFDNKKSDFFCKWSHNEHNTTKEYFLNSIHSRTTSVTHLILRKMSIMVSTSLQNNFIMSITQQKNYFSNFDSITTDLFENMEFDSFANEFIINPTQTKISILVFDFCANVIAMKIQQRTRTYYN